jgi:hypothetical protein
MQHDYCNVWRAGTNLDFMGACALRELLLLRFGSGLPLAFSEHQLGIQPLLE